MAVIAFVGAAVAATPAAAQHSFSDRAVASVAAPEPWLQQDPGDSLYRAGRNALSSGDYRAAARNFRTLRDRYPRSGYVGDSYYWEAYALSKIGGKENLQAALQRIETQEARHAESRTIRDSRELRVRVQGELAQLGDAVAAAGVAEAVAPIALPVTPAPAAGVMAPVGPVSAAPTPPPGRAPRSPRAQRADRDCDEEDDERLMALNALLNMNAERAVPILTQVLERRDEGSVCLRRQAVFLISQKKTPETARILLNAVRSDPDPEVRENAVFWLSQVPTPEAVSALDSILQYASDHELQDKAVFALSQIKDERAGRALRDHLERAGTPDEIKENIIFWLGQERSPANAQYLKDFYARTTSESLKEKVIFSLSQMSLEENAQWLMGLAQDDRQSVEVRKNALFWAGQMKSVPFSDLAALYDRVQDREIKEHLIFVYSQRSSDSAAVDRLMAIARSETDAELRKNAIFWLSQTRDPRVEQFLLEIINR
jgi:HEAT repeat protein